MAGLLALPFLGEIGELTVGTLAVQSITKALKSGVNYSLENPEVIGNHVTNGLKTLQKVNRFAKIV